MPECEDRRLTTVSRREGHRDGFRHMPGAGRHTAESLFHAQAKALIANWAKEKYPHLTVTLEQATTSGERRADVMVSREDGRHLTAFEVQYSPLEVSEWQRRHDSYRKHEIVDVWLLRNDRPHLITVDAERVRLGALHQAMARAGVACLWIDPLAAEIGTTVADLSARRCECGETHAVAPPAAWGAPQPADGIAHFRTDPLADCELFQGVFRTPTIKAFTAGESRWHEVRDAEHAREAARRQVEDQRRQAIEREDDLLRAHHDQHRNHWQAEWHRSPERATMVERYGEIPDVLARELPNDLGVLALPERWHTALYVHHVEDRSEGYRVGFDRLEETLTRCGIPMHEQPARRRTAIQGFVKALVEARLVVTTTVHGRSLMQIRDDIDRRNRKDQRVAEREAEKQRIRAHEAKRRWHEARVPLPRLTTSTPPHQPAVSASAMPERDLEGDKSDLAAVL